MHSAEMVEEFRAVGGDGRQQTVNSFLKLAIWKKRRGHLLFVSFDDSGAKGAGFGCFLLERLKLMQHLAFRGLQRA